jgi:hypothetical protein
MSSRRPSPRKRIRGELIGTHCDACGEPLIFVASAPAWDFVRDVTCPSCASSRSVDPNYVAHADRASIALQVLLLASCLKTALESEAARGERRGLAESCRQIVDELTQLSAQIAPPTA